MARCKACGTDAPPMARFCNICGAAVAPAAPAPTAPTPTAARPAPTVPAATAPVAPSGGMNKAAVIALVSGIILILAAGYLFARSSGLLNPNTPQSPQGAVITAPRTQPESAPILNPPSVDGPKAPVIQPPPTTGNPMPEDVIAYLRWLKWFEGERKKLEAKGVAQFTGQLQDVIKDYTTGDAMGLLDGSFENGTEPTKKATNHGEEIGKVIQEWNQAASLFKQKSPPNACAPLATSYGLALDSGVAEMTKLLGTLNNALGSLTGQYGQDTGGARQALTDLMQQKNNRSGSKNVDSQFADANSALDSLRDRYTQIPPDIDRSHFSITSGGGGLSLPVMGM